MLIDESTQATEPECLIPMVLGAKQVGVENHWTGSLVEGAKAFIFNGPTLNGPTLNGATLNGPTLNSVVCPFFIIACRARARESAGRTDRKWEACKTERARILRREGGRGQGGADQCPSPATGAGGQQLPAQPVRLTASSPRTFSLRGNPYLS